MLDIKVTIENEKVVIAGLEKLAKEIPGAIRRGLERSAVGIYRAAFNWLSGPARSQVRLRDTDKHKKSRLRGQSDLLGARPGGWPVPRITGHLREELAWLSPGQSKAGDLGTFTAGDDEVVVFDSASYAPAIFLGLGSSRAYGPRDALRAALDQFNHGGNIQKVIEEEIQKEIDKGK
jgi:hypothetical protein